MQNAGLSIRFHLFKCYPPLFGDQLFVLVHEYKVRKTPMLDQEWSQTFLGSYILPAINQIKFSKLVEKSFGKVAVFVHQVVAGLTNEYFVEKFLQWINSPYLACVGPPSPNSVVISGTPREGNHNVDVGLGKLGGHTPWEPRPRKCDRADLPFIRCNACSSKRPRICLPPVLRSNPKGFTYPC
ncbi:hypothetical protein V2J09_000104 [Rumex salicifolius]